MRRSEGNLARNEDESKEGSQLEKPDLKLKQNIEIRSEFDVEKCFDEIMKCESFEDLYVNLYKYTSGYNFLSTGVESNNYFFNYQKYFLKKLPNLVLLSDHEREFLCKKIVENIDLIFRKVLIMKPQFLYIQDTFEKRKQNIVEYFNFNEFFRLSTLMLDIFPDKVKDVHLKELLKFFIDKVSFYVEKHNNLLPLQGILARSIDNEDGEVYNFFDKNSNAYGCYKQYEYEEENFESERHMDSTSMFDSGLDPYNYMYFYKTATWISKYEVYKVYDAYTGKEVNYEDVFKDYFANGQSRVKHELYKLSEVVPRINGMNKLLDASELNSVDIDFLFSVFVTDPVHLYGSIIKVYDKEPKLFLRKVYKLLRDKNINIRFIAKKILNSIELGKIGLSVDQIEYLGKHVKIENLELDDSFVQRISDNGQMGVFNTENEMTGYFDFNILDSYDDNVVLKIVEFNMNQLFNNYEDLSKEEKVIRDEILEVFKKRYFEIKGSDFFIETGVQMNNLSLREQLSFLLFYNRAKKEQKNKVKEFVKKYNTDGFKIFVILQQLDVDVMNLIESLESKFNDQVIFKLLSNYAFIINSISNNERLMNAGSNYQAIYQELVNKGLNLLLSVIESDENMALKKLELYHKEAQVLLTLSKSVVATNGQIEKIDGVIVTKLNSTKISKEDQDEILRISRRNWSGYSDFRKDIPEMLEKNFDNSDYDFNILKFEGRIICFFKTKETENGIEISSVNIVPDAKGAMIGGDFLKKEFEVLASKESLELTTDMSLTIAPSYFHRYGFVADSATPDYEGTSEVVMHCLRDKDGKKYQYSGKRFAELVKENNKSIVVFNLDQISPEIKKRLAELKKNGEVISAFDRNPKNPKEVIIAFEAK